ncbi:MAG TPA: fluoride efflux transporter CrcB [Blastocatellia bacterium]|jgi:CrcB protein|nr:fluoride efflux transporter CrcB [Blastocatellia bacterium]
MRTLILVMLGGAFGTGFRYSLSSFVHLAVKQSKFPLATFIVNLSGSFLIGLLAEAFASRYPVSPALRAAVLAGVLGGYTTFSSFSFETLSLIRGGDLWLAALNVSASVLLGLAGVWAGMRFAQMI